jgi:20S proteasome alpha/beta subunit
MKRDAASGDGVDIAIINKKEFKLLSENEIADRNKKLGID